MSAGEPLPIPDSLATLIAERFRLLPDDTRDAVLLAATAPVPRLETLAHAGVVDPERVLGPAIREGILALERGFVRFEHPLLAQAALASVDEATLRELHIILARTASSEDTRAHQPRRCGDRAGRGGCGGSRAGCLEGTRPRRLPGLRRALRARELADASPGARCCARALAAEGAFIDLADLHYADRDPHGSGWPRRGGS